MGNALETCSISEDGGDVGKDDQRWLSVRNEALTNDTYVASVFDGLPKYDDTIAVEVISTRNLIKLIR